MSKIPSATPPATPSEVEHTVAQVHKFGAASESIFRRLYRGLHRRSDVQAHLLQQRELLLEQAKRNEELDRRQRHLQRALHSRATELERLHAVIGSVNDGIILQDLNGKVTMMNRAARVMLGGRKAFWDSALGSLFEQYRAVTHSPAELMPLGESDEIALNHRIVRAQVVAIGDENKRRIGTIILMRDVTHDALAQRLKDGYVSQIARELEKPMSLIKLAGELLGAKPEDAAVNRQLLNKLLFNVDMLDQLVLELLDIAELNAGTFDVKREAVSVEAFLWSVVRGINQDFQARGIDLLVMARGISGLQVRGDDKRLQWALGHLLRNGAQYNRHGGYVALAARASVIADSAYVSIRVTDNGIGIGEKDLPHIFKRFYRGDSSSLAAGESRQGLGQGLYVATAICEAHGGFLQVRSRLHVGSAFTMGLPLYG